MDRPAAIYPSLSPLDVLARWPLDHPPLLLHSGRYHPQWARRSILATPLATYRFALSPTGTPRSAWQSPSLPAPIEFTHRPFADLRRLLNWGRGALWIGCLSYDLGRCIERLPSLAQNDRDWPLIELGYCPGWLVHDTHTGRWSPHGAWSHSSPPALLPQPLPATYRCSPPRSVFSPDTYIRAVRRCLDYIAAGDIFQVNLSQRLSTSLAGPAPASLRALYANLALASPPWYGAYFELPAADPAAGCRALASASPELFLQVDPAGCVTTRPIKGTRPASAAPAELASSPKDRAELNMIVDLMRNDLGRVCAYGSVRVTEPRVIESHPTVHHGVATVQGRLHASKDLVDLLRACLPGGSVTGAPKVRAMQIIEELEPVRRGPYCGALGYLSQRELCLGMTIRTMLVQAPPERDATVDIHVGGAIVADSTPPAEYQETLDKAQPLLAALHPPSAAPAIAAAPSPTLIA